MLRFFKPLKADYSQNPPTIGLNDLTVCTEMLFPPPPATSEIVQTLLTQNIREGVAHFSDTIKCVLYFHLSTMAYHSSKPKSQEII